MTDITLREMHIYLLGRHLEGAAWAASTGELGIAGVRLGSARTELIVAYGSWDEAPIYLRRGFTTVSDYVGRETAARSKLIELEAVQ